MPAQLPQLTQTLGLGPPEYEEVPNGASGAREASVAKRNYLVLPDGQVGPVRQQRLVDPASLAMKHANPARSNVVPAAGLAAAGSVSGNISKGRKRNLRARSKATAKMWSRASDEVRTATATHSVAAQAVASWRAPSAP